MRPMGVRRTCGEPTEIGMPAADPVFGRPLLCSQVFQRGHVLLVQVLLRAVQYGVDGGQLECVVPRGSIRGGWWSTRMRGAAGPTMEDRWWSIRMPAVARRSIGDRWWSTLLRLVRCLYAPWGCVVRVASLTKSRRPPRLSDCIAPFHAPCYAQHHRVLLVQRHLHLQQRPHLADALPQPQVRQGELGRTSRTSFTSRTFTPSVFIWIVVDACFAVSTATVTPVPATTAAPHPTPHTPHTTPTPPRPRFTLTGRGPWVCVTLLGRRSQTTHGALLFTNRVSSTRTCSCRTSSRRSRPLWCQ